MWPFKKKSQPSEDPLSSATNDDVVFEPYLALGRLSEVTSPSDGISVAHYVDAAGDPIYQITASPNRVEIEEYFEGEQVRFTTDADLQQGFLKHIALGGLEKNTRLVAHQEALERKYNTKVHLGGMAPLDVVAYYPAGLLFTVRLPIVDQNQEAVVAYWNAIEADTTDVPVPEAKQRIGTILTIEGGVIHAEPLKVLELEVSLYELDPMIEEMSRRGLIPSDIKYRLEAIDDAFVRKGGFLIAKVSGDGGPMIFARVMAKDEPALREHFRKLALKTFGDVGAH